jgi:hypothetical protein
MRLWPALLPQHLTKILFGCPLLPGTAQTWRMLQRNDATSTAPRLGNLTYWTACIAALLWAIFVLTATAGLPHPDWTISTPIAMVGAAIIWSCGFVARYILVRWREHKQ